MIICAIFFISACMKQESFFFICKTTFEQKIFSYRMNLINESQIGFFFLRIIIRAKISSNFFRWIFKFRYQISMNDNNWCSCKTWVHGYIWHLDTYLLPNYVTCRGGKRGQKSSYVISPNPHTRHSFFITTRRLTCRGRIEVDK